MSWFSFEICRILICEICNDIDLGTWLLYLCNVLCNRLKINIMLLMTIYLIYKFSILVLGSILRGPGGSTSKFS